MVDRGDDFFADAALFATFVEACDVLITLWVGNDPAYDLAKQARPAGVEKVNGRTSQAARYREIVFGLKIVTVRAALVAVS